ncbi:MAG: GTPase ObgE [Chloroflexota bacterium]
MFDQVEIKVRSGRGGDGASSFRHEKHVPYGGPDGGDGGDGGSVVIRAVAGVTTLREFRNKGLYRAVDGKNGRGKKKHGGNGGDLELAVPVGTLVWDKALAGESPLADLEIPGRKVLVAQGGKGGMGNTHFARATNQAPRLIQKGEDSREREIILEMRLIADVGIIGYPNAGKSTLVTAISAARPKVASYPFTTLEPVLCAVELGGQSVIFAEVPGLVDGAHLGRGLGHQFLRHVLRTRVLVLLLDGTSGAPAEDMRRLDRELVLYDATLDAKPKVVAVNKLDLPQVRAGAGRVAEELAAAGSRPIFISAANGEGLKELLAEVARVLLALPVEKAVPPLSEPEKVFKPQPETVGRGSFHKEGDTFVVSVPGLERIVAGPGGSEAEVIAIYRRRLSRSGLARAMVRAGVKPGDKVRLGSLAWEWP